MGRNLPKTIKTRGRKSGVNLGRKCLVFRGLPLVSAFFRDLNNSAAKLQSPENHGARGGGRTQTGCFGSFLEKCVSTALALTILRLFDFLTIDGRGVFTKRTDENLSPIVPKVDSGKSGFAGRSFVQVSRCRLTVRYDARRGARRAAWFRSATFGCRGHWGGVPDALRGWPRFALVNSTCDGA